MGNIGAILGLYWGYVRVWGLGFRVHWGYLGIMENKMETTIVYWGYSGIMEKKMEATIVFLLWGLGFRAWGLGFRDLRFRVWGLGVGVWGLGFRVNGA